MIFLLLPKHIELKGEELRQFKNRLEIQDGLKHANVIYLWTEKGALLHAKSLNTDKAWEVYDYLVDFYFRVKNQDTSVPVTAEPEQGLSVTDEYMFAYTRGIVLGVLRHELEEKSTMEILERLSARGRATVMKLIFGEVAPDEK